MCLPMLVYTLIVRGCASRMMGATADFQRDIHSANTFFLSKLVLCARVCVQLGGRVDKLDLYGYFTSV